MPRINKKFANGLRGDLKVDARGNTITVTGGGLTYRVDRRGANAQHAAIVNSKIPAVVIRPPFQP